MYVVVGEGEASCGVAKVKRYAITLLGPTCIEQSFGEQHDRHNVALSVFGMRQGLRWV